MSTLRGGSAKNNYHNALHPERAGERFSVASSRPRLRPLVFPSLLGAVADGGGGSPGAAVPMGPG